jgi:hypothetical protein
MDTETHFSVKPRRAQRREPRDSCIDAADFFDVDRIVLMRISACCGWLLVALVPVSIARAEERSPAQEMAKLIMDEGCEFVPEFQKAQWRDANAADYQSPGWQAIRKFSASSTPWRAVGDFNGDGLADEAKVVIHKGKGHWMFGVNFGHDDKIPCARSQIASNSSSEEPQGIHGLISLPRETSTLACFHVNAAVPLECSVPEGSALAARTTDALIAVNDDATALSAYLWQPFRDMRKSDGTPLMAFGSHSLDIHHDVEALEATQNANASAPKAGDAVDPKARAALIQRFEAAYQKAHLKPFRSTTTYSVNGKPSTDGFSRMVVEFVPPASRRTVQEMGDNPAMETIEVGGKSYANYMGQVSELGPAGAIDPRSALGLGQMRIVAMKPDEIEGRAVDTLMLAGLDPIGGEATREVSIDRVRGVPVQERDRTSSGESLTRYAYDIDIAPIQAPK